MKNFILSLNLLEDQDFRSLTGLPIFVGGKQITRIQVIQVLLMALSIMIWYIYFFHGYNRKDER